MATFLKRQKEMKRLEKQREKAERRARKKLINRTPGEPSAEGITPGQNEAPGDAIPMPPEPVPHS
jgi:hypothetical protein